MDRPAHSGFTCVSSKLIDGVIIWTSLPIILSAVSPGERCASCAAAAFTSSTVGYLDVKWEWSLPKKENPLTNPDAPLDNTAEALAETGAGEDQIAGAAQGFATVYDADGPFGPPDAPGTLPTLPSLPDGYDWRVILQEHRDTDNLTDNGSYDWSDYDWQGWYWEDGRPICGHKLAIVYLRQNTVVLHQRSVQVEGLDTEYEFVSAIVRAAERLYSDNDFNRNTWLTQDFPGLQES